MKIYLNDNVYDKALERIRWLFSEFETVIVNFSGGKDSTTVLGLTLQVAEELGRLPIPVVFIDQELEYQNTVDYVERTMKDDRIIPYWIQVPVKMTNNAAQSAWITIWEPGGEWMRDKHPVAFHDNIFGAERFYDLFGCVADYISDGKPHVKIAGVRAEESPARLKGLTSYVTYGGETWGKKENERKGQFTMYPVYDWSYTDVWHYIESHGLDYNKIYDHMYRYGVANNQMRVSSLHHETSLPALFRLQEIEPDTWAKVVNRLEGATAVQQLDREFLAASKLPPMFRDWEEYRDHLLENLIADVERKAHYRKMFAQWCARYEDIVQPELIKAQIKTILTDDIDGQKLTVFAASHGMYSKNRGSKGGSEDGRKYHARMSK